MPPFKEGKEYFARVCCSILVSLNCAAFKWRTPRNFKLCTIMHVSAQMIFLGHQVMQWVKDNVTVDFVVPRCSVFHKHILSSWFRTFNM